MPFQSLIPTQIVQKVGHKKQPYAWGGLVSEFREQTYSGPTLVSYTKEIKLGSPTKKSKVTF